MEGLVTSEVIFLALALIFTLLFFGFAEKKHTDKPIITELIIYPIKSCQGISVKQAKLSKR